MKRTTINCDKCSALISAGTDTGYTVCGLSQVRSPTPPSRAPESFDLCSPCAGLVRRLVNDHPKSVDL